MISAITESALIKASEDPQPNKLLAILLSTAIFIAVSVFTAILTYRMKKKKYSEEQTSLHDDVKEQKNDS